MSISSSISQGVSVGSVFGLLAATASLLIGPPIYLAIIPTLFAGSMLGAAAGGVLAASSHLMIHAVPGLRTLMGEPKENKSVRLPKPNYLATSPTDVTREDTSYDRVRDDWAERIAAERAIYGSDISR